MRNTGLEEAETGIKIAGRNTNNLRYADDTTLMIGSKEELKSLLVKVKEESEKVGLKPNPTQPSVQFSSVAQSCLTLCDPLNHSTPGLPVYHQLPEFTQTHVQVRKQQLELDMEQQTDFKQEKEYVKAVYCHPAYLTYMQSTS